MFVASCGDMKIKTGDRRSLWPKGEGEAFIDSKADEIKSEG
jgi:hypothetical protein